MDQSHFNASLRSTAVGTCTVHELRAASGLAVREFASPAGKIFAVAWQASSLPDMRQLLGSHFEEFQQAVAAQNLRGNHAPIIVHLPGLVVEMGGHMRAFTGRAYLPDAVPSGVRKEDIR